VAERIAQNPGASTMTVNGEGPEAQLMRGILGGFAQYERALITLRTKDGLAHERGKGERVGVVPSGNRLAADGVQLLDHAAKQADMEAVRELRASGCA